MKQIRSSDAFALSLIRQNPDPHCPEVQEMMSGLAPSAKTVAQRILASSARKKQPRAFFYHYNKPASLRAGKPQISVHWKNCCHIVDNIYLFDIGSTHGRINLKRQPHFVMAGKGVVRVLNNVAYVSGY